MGSPFGRRDPDHTGPQRPAPTPTKRAAPVAPAYGRATPSLRLGPPANLVDGSGQECCRFGNGAWAVKPINAHVITLAPGKGLRGRRERRKSLLATGSRRSLFAHRAPLILPGSCFGPWSAQRAANIMPSPVRFPSAYLISVFGHVRPTTATTTASSRTASRWDFGRPARRARPKPPVVKM